MITPTARRLALGLLQAGVRAVPVSEHQGPRLTAYLLRLAPAAMPRALGLGPVLRAAVGCDGLTLAQRGATLEVTVPRASAVPLSLAAMPPGALGLDGLGRPVRVVLDERRPHAVVAGMTGSGKSEFLRALALGESQKPGTDLVLIDMKGGAFDELAAMGHQPATDPAAARDALAWARARIGADPRLDRVVVIVDEAARLDTAGRSSALDIAERGRSSRVHLVLATQLVRADVLDRRVTTAAEWRVCGRVFDATASRLVLGQPGAERLTGAGDMLLSVGGAPAVRFQAALAGPGDWGRAGAGRELGIGNHSESPNSSGEDERRVAWAAGRIADRGRVSAADIAERFGVGTTTARRIRDEAATYLPTQEAPLLAFPVGRVGASR